MGCITNLQIKKESEISEPLTVELGLHTDDENNVLTVCLCL